MKGGKNNESKNQKGEIVGWCLEGWGNCENEAAQEGD